METQGVVLLCLLLWCCVRDAHADAKMAKRMRRVKGEMKAPKVTAVDNEIRFANNFKTLESSLKEELTETFLRPLVNGLVKHAITDILRDHTGDTISAHAFDEINRLKADVLNTKAQLRAVKQELRRFERERDTYRKSHGKLHDDMTKGINALQLQLNKTEADLCDSRMVKSGLEEDLLKLNTSSVMADEINENDVDATSLTTSSTLMSFKTTSFAYPGAAGASTGPSQDPAETKRVAPVPVTTQQPDLQATPSPDDRDLYYASQRGDLAAVRRILSAGHANINCRMELGTPLLRAAEQGHRQVVKFLVRKGADLSLLDHDDNTILHVACRGGHLRTVQLVLSLNVVDINSRNWSSRTAVMLAAWYEHKDVVELLLREGADVFPVDDDGHNLLYFACRGGDVGTVELVLSLNVFNVNQRGDYRRTPVTEAAWYKHRDVVELLVREGADVSLVDKGGDNTLHMACRAGDFWTAAFVLSLNVVDVNAKNKEGLTATYYARLWKHKRLVDLLESYGGH